MTSVPRAVVPYDPFGTSVATTNLPFYNPLDYGVGTDGTTDYVTQLQACIDAAYAAGGVNATVWLPDGTFMIGAALNVKCQLRGSGTIKTKTTNTVLQTLTIPMGYDGACIRDIKFDGNVTGSIGAGWTAGTYGVLVYSNNCIVQQATVSNTRGPGIYAENTSAFAALFNRISNCRSKETAGYSGDGIIVTSPGGANTDPLIVGNIIDTVQRVGITCEGDGTHKTARARIAFNIISNAASANTGPDAAGQINAGIWCENTSAADIIGNSCRATHIGIYLNPITTTTESAFDCTDNEIASCDLYGYNISGAAQNGRVRIAGGWILGHTGGVAVYIANAGGDITIDGLHFGAVTYTSSNNGLILVDQTGATYPVKSLTIQNCTKETNTGFQDAADINIVNGGANLQRLEVLDNKGSWSMAMRDVIATAAARNTNISRPSTATVTMYSPLNATNASFTKERNVRLVTAAADSPANTDYEIHVNRAAVVTITLPDPRQSAGAGGVTSAPRASEFIVIDDSGAAAANNITVAYAGGGANLMNGAGSKVISTNWGGLRIRSDGSQYIVSTMAAA